MNSDKWGLINDRFLGLTLIPILILGSKIITADILMNTLFFFFFLQ